MNERRALRVQLRPSEPAGIITDFDRDLRPVTRRLTGHALFQPGHPLKPLGQCSNLFDGGIAVPEPEVRTEARVVTCVRHGPKTDLRGGLVVRRSCEDDRAAWLARCTQVYP